MILEKITKLWVDKVEKIEIVKAKDYDEVDFAQSEITITCENGEKVELLLEATSAKKLEFKEKEETEWLTPKVYKGSKEE